MSDIVGWLRGEIEALGYAEHMTEDSNDRKRRLLNHRRRLTEAADEIERLRAGAERREALEAWQELLERDDRTSPEEYPDMCLITFEELTEFMCRDNRDESDASEPTGGLT